ncbi:hypothetical protein ABFS82_14G226500 [Erythranthe guttata]
MANPLRKAALIGCNRLLLVNPPAAAAVLKQKQQQQQQHKAITSTNHQIRVPFSTRAVFNEWCKGHGKKYSTEKIEKLAFKNFEDNYKIVSENRNGSLLGLPHIMDRSPDYVTARPNTFTAPKLNNADEAGPVIECRSVKEWNKHFKKGTKSKKLVVVDFSNESISSRAIDPEIAKKKGGRVIFLKSVAKEFNVECDKPTFLFLKDGVEMGRLSSAC